MASSRYQAAITQEDVTAFRRATLDESDGSGAAVSPIVLARLLMPVLKDLVLTSSSALPPILHVEQRIELFTAVPLGQPLDAEAAVVDQGRYGKDEALDVAISVSCAGDAVARLVSTVLFPGVPATATRQRARLRVRYDKSNVLAVGRRSLSQEVVDRYALASGDDNPIHLDPSFARSQGLPSTIVHGMCTLGTVLGASRELPEPPWPPGVVEVRFMAPIPTQSEIEIRFHPADQGCAFAVLPAAGTEPTFELAAAGRILPRPGSEPLDDRLIERAE